jgi:hypothetical protein
MKLAKPLHFTEDSILFGLAPTIDFRVGPYFECLSFKYLAKHGVARMPVNLVEQKLRVLLIFQLLRIEEPIESNTFGI